VNIFYVFSIRKQILNLDHFWTHEPFFRICVFLKKKEKGKKCEASQCVLALGVGWRVGRRFSG
jgi:hypothetical protein